MPLTNANLKIYREQEKLDKLAAQQNVKDSAGGIASQTKSVGKAGHSSANEEENSGYEEEENSGYEEEESVSSGAICVLTNASLVESGSD